MLVSQVRCNLCRCHLDTDGFIIRGGYGLLIEYGRPGVQHNFLVADEPMKAEIHLCHYCLDAIKKLKTDN